MQVLCEMCIIIIKGDSGKKFSIPCDSHRWSEERALIVSCAIVQAVQQGRKLLGLFPIRLLSSLNFL